MDRVQPALEVVVTRAMVTCPDAAVILQEEPGLSRYQEMREDETARLGQLEGVIERGLKTFVEVGEALAEIRDNQFYKVSGYSSFDKYLSARWGISRTHAYRLIDDAKVAKLVSPNGDIPNEAQARELVPLAKKDPDAAVEVWKKVKKDGGRITATKVGTAVREVLYPTHDPGPIPKPSYPAEPVEPLTPRARLEVLRLIWEDAMASGLDEALQDVMDPRAEEFSGLEDEVDALIRRTMGTFYHRLVSLRVELRQLAGEEV